MALNDFLLNSDYPIEKIVGSVTGSFTRTNANYLTSEVVSHGLSYAPLYIMQWSTSPDFIPAYTEQLIGDGATPLLEAQTNSTSVILSGYVPSGSVTFYYQVLFFMPPDVNVAAIPTESLYDDFVLNTDYNYPKIFQEGKSTSTITINHNLGYYPLAEYWLHRTSDDVLRHFVASETDAGNEGGVIVTTTSATFTLFSGYDYLYYKVYGDET